MGLLIAVLTTPVLGPIRGVKWIAEKVNEQARHELFDEEAVRRKLTETELRYDLGEITREEFEASEEALLQRLRIIREAAAG